MHTTSLILRVCRVPHSGPLRIGNSQKLGYCSASRNCDVKQISGTISELRRTFSEQHEQICSALDSYSKQHRETGDIFIQQTTDIQTTLRQQATTQHKELCRLLEQQNTELQGIITQLSDSFMSTLQNSKFVLDIRHAKQDKQLSNSSSQLLEMQPAISSVDHMLTSFWQKIFPAIILLLGSIILLFILQEHFKKEQLKHLKVKSEEFKQKKLADEDCRKICHKSAQALLVEKLSGDFLCIVVDGARASGKTWTVEYVVQQFAKENDYEVVILKTSRYITDTGLVKALEDAIGYERQFFEQLLQILRIAPSPTTVEERLDNLISIIDRFAKEYDSKVIFLLDDLEDFEKCQVSSVKRILNKLDVWGTNKVLRPIVVSSSSLSTAALLRTKAPERQVTLEMGALDRDEARNYLQHKLKLDTVDDTVLDNLEKTFNLQVGTLRQLCLATRHLEKNIPSTVENGAKALEKEYSRRIFRDLKTLYNQFVRKEDRSEWSKRSQAFKAALRNACSIKGPTEKILYDEYTLDDAVVFLSDQNIITESETQNAVPFSTIHKNAIVKFLSLKPLS